MHKYVPERESALTNAACRTVRQPALLFAIKTFCFRHSDFLVASEEHLRIQKHVSVANVRIEGSNAIMQYDKGQVGTRS
jgi:hypothetical protein